MASSAREICRLRIGSGQLWPSPTSPFDAFGCAPQMSREDVVNISSGCHPAEVVYKGQPFCFRNVLFDPCEQSCSVDCKQNGDTGEPCGTPASTGCPSTVLRSIIISTMLSEKQLSCHQIWSPSICLTFIKSTSLSFATLRKAALMSMGCTLVMWPFLQDE